MTDKPTAAQGTLIESEEDLSWALADLVPVASKILDSTATYLSKVGKKSSTRSHRSHQTSCACSPKATTSPNKSSN